MIVAFDTYYYEGFSYTVAGVFETWASEKVKYYVCSRRKGIDAEYKPGELYKRELPCIMQCLEKINVDAISSIVVDGFVWVMNDDGERVPGLGKRLQDAIVEKYEHHLSVIGIAKNPYHSKIPNCIEVCRGQSKQPLYVTCTEDFFTQHYADEIKLMFGEFRIPNIIKAIDTKTRNYCVDVNTEEESSSIKQIIRENNNNNKVSTFGDLAIDMGDFEQFVSDVKDKGFEYEGAT
jgi:deoxyribonuclease V